MNKNLLSLCALTASLCLASCNNGGKGEKIAPGDVPAPVVTALSNKYPGAADVEWEKENEDGKIEYEAEFQYDGKKKHAEFDEAGNIVEADD